MKISLTDSKLETRNSGISGTGVFTKEPIKRNARVAILGGYVISIEDLSSLKKIDIEAYRTILEIGYQVDDDAIFSPIHSSQFSTIEFMNHSCEPTCGFNGQVSLVAMRDIDKGEEITMDYATCISLEIFAIKKCRCGSSCCRNMVTANDWKDPILQKRYNGFFQPYLIRKIHSLSNDI